MIGHIWIVTHSESDPFETFMSDLLYEIYLAKPETLKSDAPVKVKDVQECSALLSTKQPLGVGAEV